MPSMERQVKAAKEAIDAIVDGSENREATTSFLSQIQDYIDEKVSELAGENEDGGEGSGD